MERPQASRWRPGSARGRPPYGDAEALPAPHPRTIGWFGTTALAMGGSNQSLFLLAALIGGQDAIPGQGSAAIPLLLFGLLLSWAAAPGWTELVLMWPNRVGGIAAACSEAFRPYNPLLSALAGTCYWWGWIPTCGLTALLSAAAIQQWFVPFVSVPILASFIVAVFLIVNLCGIKWVVRMTMPIAVISATLAFISALAPVLTGKVDWVQASTFHLNTPFAGAFGAITSVMAGIYLIGFAAPAFEAAACHVGETIDPQRNVPRAMLASALMASVYFIILPVIWLGMFGPTPLAHDLAIELGPTFAPLFGGAAKAVAIGFMVFNMFLGTIQPLAGASRTLSQLAEDGLLPRALALRNRADVPWVATVSTAVMAIFFLWIGDPVWLIAAANFTYLIGICMPSLAVWLLRRDAPDRPRPYRAGRGMIGLGLAAASVWLVSAVLGFEQFGIYTVLVSIGLAYSGIILFVWRKVSDRRRAGLPSFKRSLHVTLTGSMTIVLALDAAGYQLAVSRLPTRAGPVISGLQDILIAVALLTIAVGLVLPGMIAHSVVAVSDAAKRLVSGALFDFTRAMEALGQGNLAAAKVEFDFSPVEVRSHDEIGEMASSFNGLQRAMQISAFGLVAAREGLSLARQQLLDSNRELQARVEERSQLIDELTVARDAAQAANLAKSRFVATMSHEIRTPLNGVLTTIDLLSHSPLSAEQQKLIAIIERSGETLLALVDEVLDYSRAGARPTAAENVAFDLITLVRDKFDELAPQAGRRPIAYRLALPADRPALPVLGDPLRLTLVLQNIIANALKFTEHGFVEVALAVLGESAGQIEAEFCVTDTGVGMSEEFRQRIFEPFAQANESTTRTTEGAGLGLSIVKDIVDALGAEITVDSRLGQGSAFRIRLPLAKASPSPATICQAAQPCGLAREQCPYNNQKILVAEDNAVNQEVIAASLTRLGYKFRIADNGAAALAALDEEAFSLVLMDCRMPVLDGYDAARAIRDREAQRPAAPRIPILAISANATAADRALCLASGMDDHIAKPFTLAELRQQFARWLPAPQCPTTAPPSAPSPAAPNTAPLYHLLDIATLQAIGELQMPDQPSILQELIDSFFHTAPHQLQLIESCLQDDDLAGATLAAHGMKSASAAIGLTALAETFAAIEADAGRSNAAQARSTAQDAAHLLNRSLRELSLFREFS